MEYETGNNNRWTTDTPDELYGKYISVVATLPDDTTKWSLPLCDRYYSALMISLQDKMEEDQISMPSLDVLTTKALQLKALRLVRTAAVTSYVFLLKEKERLRHLITSNTHHDRGSLLYH